MGVFGRHHLTTGPLSVVSDDLQGVLAAYKPGWFGSFFLSRLAPPSSRSLPIIQSSSVARIGHGLCVSCSAGTAHLQPACGHCCRNNRVINIPDHIQPSLFSSFHQPRLPTSFRLHANALHFAAINSCTDGLRLGFSLSRPSKACWVCTAFTKAWRRKLHLDSWGLCVMRALLRDRQATETENVLADCDYPERQHV